MEFQFDIVPADSLSRADALAVLGTEDPGGLSDVAPGAHVSQVVRLQESADYVPTILGVVLSIPADVAVGLIASWIVRTFRGKAKAIVVDRTIIELDEGEIARIIHEHVRAEDGND